MKHTFTLPNFPGSNFEIETSFWTGKSKLTKDNVLIEQSNESGKPYLIPDQTGNIIKAFPKKSLPDFGTTLEINGVKNHIFKKLEWYQYTLGALPILMLFFGGAIGGGIGGAATMINLNIFREEGSDLSKYLKVIGVIVAAFLVYLGLSFGILLLINKS
jgi:hypothetical protein